MRKIALAVVGLLIMSQPSFAAELFVADNGVNLSISRNIHKPVMSVAAPMIRYSVKKNDDRTVQALKWSHFGKWSDLRIDVGFLYRGEPRKYSRAYLSNQQELEINSGATTAISCWEKAGCLQSQHINVPIKNDLLLKYVGKEFLDLYVYSQDGGNGEVIRVPMAHIEAIMFAPIVY